MTDIRKEDLIDVNDNKPIEEENEAISDSTESRTSHGSEPIVPEHAEQPIEHAVSKQIPPKGVTKLTPEERNALIEEAKRGIENEFYKVSFCKNGATKITKRKQPKQSVAEKLISSAEQKPNIQPVSMSNEQLLFEHIINLESQMATLRQKHKRLKRSYKQMYQDVYIDEDETGSPVPVVETAPDSNESRTSQWSEPQQDPQQGFEQQQQQPMRTIPRMRNVSWRQKLMNTVL